ncbi:MAG TPA: hypothetical protein VJU18_20105, partial [Vicinamibacteria bacterium]|nr:hypothetical protein [Vicinamibacteria bacterium]
EQVKGEAATTASDVYSLGMLLYELLARKRPYEIKTRAPEEVARVVCQQEPEKPSARADRALSRQLKGDLDTIVLKAIRKEPARRYQTVGELSEDLHRYLAGLPVLARGDTVGYRAGKFVRRHKAAVVVAGLLVASLLGGILATVRQARIAEANRARAERRFGDVRKLANSFLFEFHDAIATLPGSTPARELVVRKALEYLDGLAQEAGGDPSLQRELAAAYQKVGDVQGEPGSANLGQTAGALESHRKALGLREALAAAGAKDAELQNDLARSHGRVGTLLGVAGDAERAMFHWQRALTIRQSLLASDPTNPKAKRSLAISYHELGDAFVDRRDLPAAMSFYRQELALFQELAAADPTNPNASRNLALAHKKVGATLVRMGQMVPALEHYQEALRLDQGRLAGSPEDAQARLDVSFDHSDIGNILGNTGDITGAIDRYRKVVAIREELSQSDPRNAHARGALANAYVLLALHLAAAGRTREALAACRQSVAIRQALATAEPANPRARRELAGAERVLGDILKQSGDLQAALESYHRALTVDQALAASVPVDTGVLRDLAILYGRLAALHETLASQPRLSRDLRLERWNQARSWYEKGRTALRDLPSGGAPALRYEEPDPDEPARGVARCDAALAKLGKAGPAGARSQESGRRYTRRPK